MTRSAGDYRDPEQVLMGKERVRLTETDRKRYREIWCAEVGERSPLTTDNILRFAKAIETRMRDSIMGKGKA